ncbi:NRDE family protein [Microbacterium horticulturae]|uniref:NRDE family protein n=1 Tax=Microbacterium horticulturae TaxID=3028316 RepID=A0ABY8BYM9_9MICO|nr:NRDE family protein [Microbacterium sp. KACC 23027]WEG09299.1 NRDE family protein [Microbacterium sp. KACC 23027]
MRRCPVCTVIVRVPAAAGEPVRLLAVRDEDPARPWQPLGEWWPDRPGVIGVRDVRAGGAWLAVDAAAGRLAVLLNRESPPVPPGVAQVSRGGIVLDAVAGRPPHPTPAVLGFNLVTVDQSGVHVVTWDGAVRTELTVPPGTHMIAHHDLDDPRSPRIVAWHDAFAAADPDEWMPLLARTAQLDPADDRAIIRDNNAHGYPTQSLLLCTASVSADEVDVRYAELDRPGVWNPVTLVGPVRAA